MSPLKRSLVPSILEAKGDEEDGRERKKRGDRFPSMSASYLHGHACWRRLSFNRCIYGMILVKFASSQVLKMKSAVYALTFVFSFDRNPLSNSL